ncbi:hypothetical protein ACFS27_19250 [Promicromonospora vindobonensis]|uniref:SMI1/KNR4 family protein n=1 Tax=Promicromonospora vindobonensis TaxID=195748 RepID=A0ABW5VWN1_9MICO
MNTNIEQLTEAGNLVPSGTAFDWAGAERQIEAPIPVDYQKLIDAGGDGVWFDYIRLYAPDARYQDQNLLKAPGVFNELQAFWEDGDTEPPEDWVDDDRLVVWAGTGNGERLYWRQSPNVSAEQFPVYVADADGDRWERFDMSATDFLVGVLTGEVRSAFFSETFLRTDRVFRRYDA